MKERDTKKQAREILKTWSRERRDDFKYQLGLVKDQSILPYIELSIRMDPKAYEKHGGST